MNQSLIEVQPFFPGTAFELASQVMEKFENYGFNVTCGLSFEGKAVTQYNEHNRSEFVDKGIVVPFFGRNCIGHGQSLPCFEDYAGQTEDGKFIFCDPENYVFTSEEQVILDELLKEPGIDKRDTAWEYTKECAERYISKEELTIALAHNLEYETEISFNYNPAQDPTTNAETGVTGKKYNHILKRHGLLPIAFDGIQLEYDMEHPNNKRGAPTDYWSYYSIYRTTSGKYVLELNNRSKWPNVFDTDHAFVANSPKELYEQTVASEHMHPSDNEKNRLYKLFERAGLHADLVEEI